MQSAFFGSEKTSANAMQLETAVRRKLGMSLVLHPLQSGQIGSAGPQRMGQSLYLGRERWALLRRKEHKIILSPPVQRLVTLVPPPLRLLLTRQVTVPPPLRSRQNRDSIVVQSLQIPYLEVVGMCYMWTDNLGAGMMMSAELTLNSAVSARLIPLVVSRARYWYFSL